MDRVTLPGTGLSVSRFLFGTAGLFNVGGAKARARLLHAAVDHGFTHFDTAPYYGFGMAERDLAPILRSFPNVTVATKVGLYSPGGERQNSAQIFTRKALGRLIPRVSRPDHDFGLERAKQSLDASLRRLGRDHVELFLLHEPDLRQVDLDEWLPWLEAERARGRVGQFGLATNTDRLEAFIASDSPLLAVVQQPDSVTTKEADLLVNAGRPLQITYGYTSAARAQGLDISVPDILRGALVRNPHGAIIVGTRQEKRLGQYAEAIAAVKAGL